MNEKLKMRAAQVFVTAVVLFGLWMVLEKILLQ